MPMIEQNILHNIEQSILSLIMNSWITNYEQHLVHFMMLKRYFILKLNCKSTVHRIFCKTNITCSKNISEWKKIAYNCLVSPKIHFSKKKGFGYWHSKNICIRWKFILFLFQWIRHHIPLSNMEINSIDHYIRFAGALLSKKKKENSSQLRIGMAVKKYYIQMP